MAFHAHAREEFVSSTGEAASNRLALTYTPLNTPVFPTKRSRRSIESNAGLKIGITSCCPIKKTLLKTPAGAAEARHHRP